MARVVKDAAQRREEIVRAACLLFLSRGYDRTTMRDVMALLGVAKGTIYHYFSSKEELLDAVVAELADQSVDEMRAILAETTGNGLQRLHQLVTRIVGNETAQRREMIERLHQPSNTGMHIRLHGRIVTAQGPLIAGLIQQGCEEGLFTTEHPLECAEFILSGVQFLIDVGFYPWTTEQRARRITAFPSLIEALLQAPPGSFAFLQEAMASNTELRDTGAHGARSANKESL